MNQQSRAASSAHEWVMMNLAIFHLLLPVAALSSGYLSLLLTISLIGSAVMIAVNARQAYQQNDNEVVHAHRMLAWKRCRLLLMSYAIATGIMLLGWLLSASQPDANMQTIMLVVFSRIAAVPVVLMVLTLLVMETTSLSQARQDQMPN